MHGKALKTTFERVMGYDFVYVTNFDDIPMAARNFLRMLTENIGYMTNERKVVCYRVKVELLQLVFFLVFLARNCPLFVLVQWVIYDLKCRIGAHPDGEFDPVKHHGCTVSVTLPGPDSLKTPPSPSEQRRDQRSIIFEGRVGKDQHNYEKAYYEYSRSFFSVYVMSDEVARVAEHLTRPEPRDSHTFAFRLGAPLETVRVCVLLLLPFPSLS